MTDSWPSDPSPTPSYGAFFWIALGFLIILTIGGWAWLFFNAFGWAFVAFLVMLGLALLPRRRA